MKRRRASQNAFSLFAFQDIITAVTGVMIVIVLILALEVNDSAAGDSAAASQYEAVETMIAQLTEEAERLKEQVAESAEAISDSSWVDPDEAAEETAKVREDNARLVSEVEAESDRLASARERRSNSESDSRQRVEKNKSEGDRLEKEIKKLQARLKSIERGDRLIFNRGKSGKKTWVVELTARVRAAPIGAEQAPLEFRSTSRDFAEWARKRDPAREAFILIAKPSGCSGALSCQQLLKEKLKFDVGLQLVGEDQVVLDDELGAGGI